MNRDHRKSFGSPTNLVTRGITGTVGKCSTTRIPCSGIAEAQRSAESTGGIRLLELYRAYWTRYLITIPSTSDDTHSAPKRVPRSSCGKSVTFPNTIFSGCYVDKNRTKIRARWPNLQYEDRMRTFPVLRLAARDFFASGVRTPSHLSKTARKDRAGWEISTSSRKIVPPPL